MPSDDTARHKDSVTHAEPSGNSLSEPADNPVGGSLDIVVSVPTSINIRMVDASILADYEMWIFLASVLSSAVIGFLVAAMQAWEAKAGNTSQLFYTTLVFLILFLASSITALRKRITLTKQGKDIKLKAMDATTSRH